MFEQMPSTCISHASRPSLSRALTYARTLDGRTHMDTGRYDVYINVYQEMERFRGDVTIEAYLGNGISSCLVDIVQCTLTVSLYSNALIVLP